jgi:hypothetical protein
LLLFRGVFEDELDHFVAVVQIIRHVNPTVRLHFAIDILVYNNWDECSLSVSPMLTCHLFEMDMREVHGVINQDGDVILGQAVNALVVLLGLPVCYLSMLEK